MSAPTVGSSPQGEHPTPRSTTHPPGGDEDLPSSQTGPIAFSPTGSPKPPRRFAPSFQTPENGRGRPHRRCLTLVKQKHTYFQVLSCFDTVLCYFRTIQPVFLTYFP